MAQLGAGGMGVVYRAVDERIGREVAIKLLPRGLRGDRQHRARMLREARAAGKLNHPGIVTLHDVGDIDGRTYLVMELVEGRVFTALAREGIPWRRAVELVASACEALAAAHAHGVFHRDIKSDNLMATASGRAKVLDFGLAKARPRARTAESQPTEATAPTAPRIANMPRATDETIADPDGTSADDAPAASDDQTAVGIVMGTPQYMSPEQSMGRPVDARSEVFSLGVVLYELLVGKRPFQHNDVDATLELVRLHVPPVPSEAAPSRGIPDEVDRIASRAIAKAPGDRYPDMTSFGAALSAAVARRGAPGAWIAAAIAAAVAIAAVVGLTLLRERTGPPPMAVTATHRLTFDPGCEEFPRFTADGKAIVYNGLVDGDFELLTLNRETLARGRLTHAPGWDYGPTLSPDGQSVAYVHRDAGGREARVVDIAGDRKRPSQRVASAVGYPAWTTDGALLLGDALGRVVRRELASGAEQVVATLPAGAYPYHVLQLRSTGDVVILWFTSLKQRPDGMVIGELDRATGAVRVVEEGLVEYEGGLVPDTRGDGYYYFRKGATTGNELCWRRFGSTEPATVVPGGLSPSGGLDVARDGKAVVFSTCTEQQGLARLRAGAPPQPITRGEWHDRNPSRIDARRVLIASDRDGAMAAWLLDPVNGEARVVEGARNILVPAPSPDGKTVAFAAEHGRGGLAIAAVAGGPPTRLTSDPTDTAPTFTRDGASIIFQRSSPSGTHLWSIPVTGGEPRLLAPGREPAASPTEDAIVFVDDQLRLALLPLSGGPPRALTKPGDWHHPRFSPDGTRAIAVVGLVELAEVTLATSAATTVWRAGPSGGINSADYAPDGDGFIATITEYNGELWLAEGTFP